MNCEKFEKVFSAYLDEQLSGAAAGDFAAHALSCRPCRGLLDEIKSAREEMLKSGRELRTPPRLEAALLTIPAEYGAIDCTRFEELITEFLDGFVPAALYHLFEDHAIDCSECSGLLTDVVYAVAACHSVHTYEEYGVSHALTERLMSISGAPRLSAAIRIGATASRMLNQLFPVRNGRSPWGFATGSVIAFATVGLLLTDLSDDLSPAGVYRQAHVRAAEIYTQGADIYAQKDQVAAELQRVGADLGEIWQTLGGETKPPAAESDPQPPHKP